MKQGYRSDRVPPCVEGVPLAARLAVAEAMREAELEQTRDAARRARANARIKREGLESLERVMGTARRQRYVDEIARRQARLQAQLRSPAGLRMTADDLLRIPARRRRGSQAVLRKLRLSEDRLRSVARVAAETSRRSEGLTRRERWVLKAARDAPAYVLQGEPDEEEGCLYRVPPFDGSGSTSERLNNDGFSVEFTRHLDETTGRIGSSSHVEHDSPGDIDICRRDESSNVGFWFRTPAAGRIEAWVVAEAERVSHGLSLCDEWGVSYSNVVQKNWLTFRCWSAVDSRLETRLMSQFEKDGKTGGQWITSVIQPGDVEAVDFRSDVDYPKGIWVYLELGSRNFHYVYLNDVEASSRLKGTWKVLAACVSMV